MKRLKSVQNISVRPRAGKTLSACSSVLLALSLGLGSVLWSGCLAVPAVVVTTATITTAAVVSEGERLARHPDTEHSAIVQTETEGESACGERC